MIDMEGTHDNDDEPLSFVSLAALTANVVRYLELDKQKEDASERSDKDEKRANERLEFVNRRLRDLRRFEDRAGGKRRK